MFTNFQYQLQRERFEDILESKAELVVVDIDDAKFTPEQIATLSENKTVLSYLSVGQAHSARRYWDESWVDGEGNPIPGVAPAWLGEKVPAWAGAYQVRFWDPEWRAILLEDVERILAAGYAGVVYDVVDSFQFWPSNPDAQAQMNDLVKGLMAHGRSCNPDYIGIPNLGYQLLLDDSYLDAVSGQLAESVFYLGGGCRAQADTDWATRYLDRAVAAGKPVFVIEYVYPPELRRDAAAKARRQGYVPYMTMKALNTLEPVWQTYETA